MNPGSPKISVIIPNYNRGDLLQETLESIIKQDYQNWEAIVVDDGSSDNSEQISGAFSKNDSRITFFKRDRKPSGAPTCRNIGIALAKGNFLIFLDSDDLLMPNALSQRASIIEKEPGCDFWVFPIRMFTTNPQNADFLWNIDNGKPDLHRFLILDAPWQTSGPIWRKEAVQKIGGFTEGLACWQDVDFHLKAIISGLKGLKYYCLPPDVLYRQHETNSISQGEISSPAKLQSRKNIFINHATSLIPVMNDEIKEDLNLLGGNIAIGAAKALNTAICFSVIRFGLQNGVFSTGGALKLMLIQSFYFLRLNRIVAFDRQIRMITQKYRQDSNIGKHSYLKTQ
ncbi:MAG: glycosyltransferase family 2 protein [Bacteroidota bacterium]